MTRLSGARRLTAVLAAGTALVTGLSACSSSGSGGSSNKVAIVAYSTPEPAYDALSKAFQQTPQGKGVVFSGSYDSSGTQSKAVASGTPASYVAFSTEPDMTNLVPKFVSPDWNKNSTDGYVADSVVVLVVRKGNPLHIENWNDLLKPGVKIVTPDPASSGSAKWNLLAAYQQVIQSGGTPAQAQDYLKKFFANVVAKPSSGSDAMTTFTQGTGDVLLSYEDEAIRARAQGANIDYVVPDDTLEIQLPAAVTVGAPQAATDFLNYVKSDAGQKIMVSQGFRPVDKNVQVGTVQGAEDPSNPFPTPKDLATITDVDPGGWATVNDKFFGDPDGIVTKIEAGS